MSEKARKLQLKIKLTNETSEKLQASSEVAVKPSTSITSKLEDDGAGKKENLKSDSSAVDNPQPKEPKESITCEKSHKANDETEVNYSDHIHYEGDIAIYTNPSTKLQYTWCSVSNQWIPRTQSVQNTEKPDSADVAMETQENIESRYGFEDGKRTYTDADGSIYVWDEEKNAWFPKVDDNFLAYYQMSYGFVDNASTEEKEIEKNKEVVSNPKVEGKKKPEEPKWFDLEDSQNNKVYVSNLPLDTTEEEFIETMQKCGLIMKDPTTHKLKIKMYTKPNSQQFKGDALCTYIKVESVDLALKILDGYQIRNHRMKVQRAKFQMKGSFNPALKPKKKKRKDKEKLKKIQERLFDWRPEKMLGERAKHERVVIIKNLFEPSMFDTNVGLILEYQQDLREEFSKCGEVKKVALYDRHPEGVAQVIMKEAEEADNAVKLINGRWFGKRQLSAEIWDGKTKYKIAETDSDLNKRIDGWNKFLDDEEEKTTIDNK